jgi:hypothetical protein
MMGSDTRGVPWHARTSDHASGWTLRTRIQSILAALAEIDRAYATDLDTVRTSAAPVEIKQGVIDTLRQKHQERRAPYLQELRALQI